MNKRTYRVAIVGGAGMWGKLYLRAAAEHEQVVPILVDSSARREEFAESLDISEIYASLDELLAHETPDVVCNVVPVGTAHELVEKCARAGVRVISCEKPIAVELSTADRMVDICREHGAAFGCGTAYWEVPVLQQTAAWIAEGHIGDIVSVAIPGGLPVEALSSDALAALEELRAEEMALGIVAFDCESKIIDPVEGRIERELYADPPK